MLANIHVVWHPHVLGTHIYPLCVSLAGTRAFVSHVRVRNRAQCAICVYGDYVCDGRIAKKHISAALESR